MTPENDASKKEKELVEKFMGEVKNHFNYGTNEHDLAIASALICVDEIIGSYNQYKGMHDQDFINADILYWQKVKESINKL